MGEANDRLGGARAARDRDEIPRFERPEGLGTVDEIASVLAFLGLPPDCVAAYLAVATRPLDEAELGAATSLTPERLDHALAVLEREGLLTRLVDDPVKFAVVAPGEALGRRIGKREQQLFAARAAVRRLSDLVESSSRNEVNPSSFIQVIRGPDAVARQHLAMLEEARHEVRGCTKHHEGITSPATSEDGRDDTDSYLSALRRGVPHRWIWDRRILEIPGMADAAAECVGLGEELRTIEELPAGVVVVDDSAAVLHLYPDDPGSADVTTIVTRHPGLVTVIEELFESLWARAVPVVVDASTEDAPDFSALVALLSSGMKDEAIARHLNVSVRTLGRRIQQLMTELGVQTRFQAGVKLGALQATPGREPERG